MHQITIFGFVKLSYMVKYQSYTRGRARTVEKQVMLQEKEISPRSELLQTLSDSTSYAARVLDSAMSNRGN